MIIHTTIITSIDQLPIKYNSMRNANNVKIPTLIPKMIMKNRVSASNSLEKKSFIVIKIIISNKSFI